MQHHRCNLDEFIQIKEQINYLSRPDKQTDWKIVEKLSAHLLAENGIDLQTLVYFTVARYQLFSSFTQITKDIENIAIALISYWDREGKYDDHSSCWIRVTQPWAGQGWGVLAIPRVGQEVLVDFLDGDPDQPIITGRTYHATNVPPGKLPQSKTQMAFRSKTYKGEGYNELLFEDAPGQEQLNLHAQRDMNTVVLNDRNTIVSNRHQEIIKKNQNITVQGERNKTIHENEMTSVLGSLDTFVEKSTTKQVKKDLVISSQNGSITFFVGNSIISLNNEGTLRIESDKVKIDGGEVFFNQYSVLMSQSQQGGEEELNENSDLSPHQQLAEEWQAQSEKIAQLRAEGKHADADKFERERRAMQAAILAQAAYAPIGSTPPSGWKEISADDAILAKYGLKSKDFPTGEGFRARVFVPDPTVFGNEMKPTIAFKGTTSREDWINNLKQGMGMRSEYYERAVEIGKKVKESGNTNMIEMTGHSLGGGLASAASMASGSKATTFNAAGVRDITVKRITDIEPSKIEAYYINKELLTRVQETEPLTLSGMLDRINPQKAASYALADAGDIALDFLTPDARYTERYKLPIQTKDNIIPFGNSYQDHGMDKVIDALGGELFKTKQTIGGW